MEIFAVCPERKSFWAWVPSSQAVSHKLKYVGQKRASAANQKEICQCQAATIFRITNPLTHFTLQFPHGFLTCLMVGRKFEVVCYCRSLLLPCSMSFSISIVSLTCCASTGQRGRQAAGGWAVTVGGGRGSGQWFEECAQAISQRARMQTVAKKWALLCQGLEMGMCQTVGCNFVGWWLQKNA